MFQKHHKMENWYVNEVEAGKNPRKTFNLSDEKKNLKLIKLFFTKNIYVFGENESYAGCLPNKFIYENYRILNI